MPERNPRKWQIEVCSECGCDPEACVCVECDEIETVPVVEVLGPERMLAWAIDQLGEVAERLIEARADASRYQEALERITAAHIAGASAGELADRARATLGARRVASGGGA